MSLVAYPDSDSDPDSENGNKNDDDNDNNEKSAALLAPHAVKRKREDHNAASLPPLPAAFHDLYASNARASTSDDSSLHGGRKRAVPHVEGNWPSHVYLEWLPAHAEAEALHRLIESIQDAIEQANKTRQKKLPIPDISPSLRSELGAPLPLHISLSRTLQIKTPDREDFIDTLSSSLKKATVRPFNIQFGSLKWVSNFQRNRWFLVLGITKPAQDELNKLLRACNNAVEQCGHSGLYIGGRGDGPMEDNEPLEHTTKRRRSTQHADDKDNASGAVDRTENFHISIAWNLEEPDPAWVALLKHIDVNKHIHALEAPFDAVKAKVGNVVHSIDLGTRKGNSRRGAGMLGLG